MNMTFGEFRARICMPYGKIIGNAGSFLGYRNLGACENIRAASPNCAHDCITDEAGNASG